MPGGDGTGPAGAGAMTGRAMGFCAGYSIPEHANPIYGRGLYGRGSGARGFGRGRGMGQRNWSRAMSPYPYPTQEISPEGEMGMLQNQAKLIQEDLTGINNRIKELENIAAQQKKS